MRTLSIKLAVWLTFAISSAAYAQAENTQPNNATSEASEMQVVCRVSVYEVPAETGPVANVVFDQEVSLPIFKDEVKMEAGLDSADLPIPGTDLKVSAFVVGAHAPCINIFVGLKGSNAADRFSASEVVSDPKSVLMTANGDNYGVSMDCR